jgi:ABC-type lipoprotein export system ATPase subunit
MADPRGRHKDRINQLIEQFGLAPRAHHLPRELSAGERQRTAIARALVNKPQLILADEPTGNLDPENGHEVVNCLSSYRDEGGMVVMVTHGNDADERADRIIRLRDGVLAPTEAAAC